MTASPQALAMVLSGEGRTATFHIEAQAQPVSRLCRLRFPLFFYSGPFRITGNFCGACLRFGRTMCFLKKCEEYPKNFLLSIPVCGLCVFESETPLCTAWVASPFPFAHVPGPPLWHPVHPVDADFPGGCSPPLPRIFDLMRQVGFVTPSRAICPYPHCGVASISTRGAAGTGDAQPQPRGCQREGAGYAGTGLPPPPPSSQNNCIPGQDRNTFKVLESIRMGEEFLMKIYGQPTRVLL